MSTSRSLLAVFAQCLQWLTQCGLNSPEQVWWLCVRSVYASRILCCLIGLRHTCVVPLCVATGFPFPAVSGPSVHTVLECIWLLAGVCIAHRVAVLICPAFWQRPALQHFP